MSGPQPLVPDAAAPVAAGPSGPAGATRRTILLICNLDTRGAEILRARDRILERGHDAVLLDFSMEAPPPIDGDLTCDRVAERGGMGIEAVRAAYRTDRHAATTNQIRGATALAADLLAQGRLHGVLGIGGATSSLVSTRVMQTLPFGLPKVMASPMAGHPAYVGEYVGTSDITMLHTVVDVVRMNPLLQSQVDNAVGAICGMVEMGGVVDPPLGPRAVAVSSFGFGELAVQSAVAMLEEAGCTPVVFHAQGRGDRAMEHLVGHGRFAGVLDLCTGGVIEHLLQGNRDPGPGRLGGAAAAGVPAVLGPCGLDMVGLGGRTDRLAALADRARFVQDELRVQVRTSAAEVAAAAATIAERLTDYRAPYVFLVPTRGWSSLDRPGGPLHDPVADAALVRVLRDRLPPESVKEVDLALYSQEFARLAVDELLARLEKDP